MASINVNKLAAPNVPGVFDSNICSVNLCVPWTWEVHHYWWLYAEHPEALAWQISGDLLQVKIKDIWTTATWIGPDQAEWITLRRSSDNIDLYVAILNGRVIERAWAMCDIHRSRSDYVGLEIQFKSITARVKKIPGQGSTKMPDFTDEQLDELHRLHDERYLEAAAMFASEEGTNKRYYKSVMEQTAERLAEIGFKVPEHDFKRETQVVPIYRIDGVDAVFVTDPQKRHFEGKNCECAICYHNQDHYMDNDCCSCENCMDNLDHWGENGNDPEHCNFCAEFRKHLDEAYTD